MVNVDQICTIVISAVAVIYLLVGMIWGIKRGFTRSLFRLVTLVISAVIAYIISRGLMTHFGQQMQDYLVGWVDSNATSVAEFLHASPTLVVYVLDICCALVAPILYSALFFLLRIVLWFVYVVLCLFLPSRKRKPLGGLSRLTGVVVSVVGCILIVVSLLMPYAGYVKLAATVYPEVESSGVVEEGVLPEGLDSELATLSRNPAVNIVNQMGGAYLFLQLSHGSGVDVETECRELLRLIPAVMDIATINFDAVFDTEQTVDLSPIREELIPVVDESDFYEAILAEILAYAGARWYNGEEVLSINIKEQLPESYAGALDATLLRLSTTTKDRVLQDLTDLTDGVETIASTYTYLVRLGDTSSGATQEDLTGEMHEILISLTPGSAELVSGAITGILMDNANLQDENSGVLASIVSESLTEIANLSDEEKEAEAAAINTLVSYTSQTRLDEVDSDQVLDTIMESKVVQSVVQERGAVNEETGEADTQIKVTAAQKASIDSMIEARMETATQEEQKTLQAIQNMLIAASADTETETGTTTEPGEDVGPDATVDPNGSEDSDETLDPWLE